VNLFFADSPKLLHRFFLTHPANCSKFNQKCPVNTKNIVRRQERDRGGAFVAAQNGVDDMMTLQTEKTYGTLLENALDAVFLTRPDGTILYANPAACGLFGYTIDEFRLLGRSAVVDPSDPRLAEALEQRRQTGRFVGVLTLVRKDGTRFSAELSSAMFTDISGEQRTSTFIRDITERERMIGELHNAQAKAKQLSGLLPICASCKKIRNDEGYWQDVAVYIREHSEADFSHGICPDCMQKLYPNL
jgi:PAS domain S-box-containing protein